MKVLIVTQYFWPESFRINEVVDSLILAGCEVTVLTGQPNYPEGKVYLGYHAGGFGRERRESGPALYRVPLFPRGKAGAMKLVLNYLSFVLCAAFLGPWLLRGKTFDVVFVYGISPILQALPAIVLKKFKRAALVTWVQDLWPESLVVTGFVKSRSVLAIVAALVRWIYRRNDLLLVQSKAFIGPVRAMAGNTPVEYHPNPGEQAFSRWLSEVVPPPFALEPGFNVVFAGNLGAAQALDTILDAAELLREHVSIRLVLVGSGSRSEWLKMEVARRKLSNVRLTGRCAAECMPAVFEQASALLVTLVRSPAMEKTIPSKLQAYLAAGKPVLACLDGEGARIVEDAGAGVASPAEDSALLAQAILHLQSLPLAEREQMGLAGKRYFLEHFEPDVLARKLVKRFGVLMRRART